MLENLKMQLYYRKLKILFQKGIVEGKIVPFDNKFYEQLSHTYISGLPVSIHIKYLRPMEGQPGKCYDRSLYMFFCFEKALLVRGDNKDLESRYGKEDAGHGWIEIEDYVYDPSLMARFDKDLYYRMYVPSNVVKYTKEDYCAIGENRKLYDDITKTTIEDFMPHGKKRIDLATIVPLMSSIAIMSENKQFKAELDNWLSMIKYDEKEVLDELYDGISCMKR